MLLRSCLFLFVTFLASPNPSLRGQAAKEAAASEPLTEAQQVMFKELEGEFTRLETFLAGLADSQPKFETQRVLGQMRKRAAPLRKNFDQTRFDEIRWEVNFEHQQMLLWLQPPRLPPPGTPAAAGPLNTLNAAEKSSGWELLFDGQSLAGWHGFREKTAPRTGWEITQGMLHNNGASKVRADLVTERKFTNFELMWEWRIAPGGSSGVKYFVTEDRPAASGHEYPTLDDESTAAGATAVATRGTAALYDVMPAAADRPLKKAGEWNRSRVVVAGNRVDHWLNGKKVLSYELGSPEMKKGIALSRFQAERGFGEKIRGSLLIVSSPQEAWFRNIKIRELK